MFDVYGPETASIEVVTRKVGLLSSVGHDLKLRAARFQLRHVPETGAIEVHVEAPSLRVVCALRAGRDDPGALKPSDVAAIERAMLDEVLRTDRYPEIRFLGTLHEGWCRGTLMLCGHSEPLAVPVGEGAAEFTVHQPQFGLRPYSALLGSLRVHPDVVVRVKIGR